jgi:hypothetical protein
MYHDHAKTLIFILFKLRFVLHSYPILLLFILINNFFSVVIIFSALLARTNLFLPVHSILLLYIYIHIRNYLCKYEFPAAPMPISLHND